LLLPQNSSVGTASGVHAHPALHQFEHDTKLFVDLGMFFFAICSKFAKAASIDDSCASNLFRFLFSRTDAGVKISVPGGMTISILLALIVGKTAGIAGFTIAGDMFFGT
jgi:hypothetical protein